MSSPSSIGSNDSYILPSTVYTGPRSTKVFWPEKYGDLETIAANENGGLPFEEPTPEIQQTEHLSEPEDAHEPELGALRMSQLPIPPAIQGFEDRRTERRVKLLGVFSRVYGIAKVVLEVMMAFGATIDTTPTGIKFYIDRAEARVTQKSCTQLLKVVEDLYYATFATLTNEIQNLEICESFHFDIRNLAPNNKFDAKDCLPEPNHLRLIFQACKEYLAADHTCLILDQELIRQKQAEWVNQALKTSKDTGFIPENDIVFRQYVQAAITDPTSPYCRQWTGLNPIYNTAPAMILGTLTEKYRGIMVQNEMQEQSGSRQEADRHSTASVHDEWRARMSNREAAYAALEGLPVGEFRRREGRMTFSAYVQENLCICFAYCECARKCTVKADRRCPCSSRLSVICDAYEIDEKECFIEQCADIAAGIFDRLSAVRRGSSVYHVTTELELHLGRFHEAMLDYRRRCEKTKEFKQHSEC